MDFRKAWTATFRALGPVDSAFYLVSRGLAGLTRNRVRLVRYVFVAQPVQPAPSSSNRQRPDNHVRRIESDDPAVATFPRPPHVIAQRFRDGSLCLASEIRGQFAGFLWLAFHTCDEDEVRCRYALEAPAISAWDYDVYVAPAFRLGRTFGRLWDAANRELAARGIAWTFSRISAFNNASLAAHRRMGAKRLSVATFLCVGPVQVMFSAAPPYLHLGWSGNVRPVIRLRPPA